MAAAAGAAAAAVEVISTRYHRVSTLRPSPDAPAGDRMFLSFSVPTSLLPTTDPRTGISKWRRRRSKSRGWWLRLFQVVASMGAWQRGSIGLFGIGSAGHAEWIIYTSWSGSLGQDRSQFRLQFTFVSLKTLWWASWANVRCRIAPWYLCCPFLIQVNNLALP